MLANMFLIVGTAPEEAVAETTSHFGLTYSISNYNPRQEETIYVTWTIKNIAEDQMELQFLGVHFEWMDYNYYYADPTSGSSKMLAIGNSYTGGCYIYLDKNDVDVGWQSYYFYVLCCTIMIL